MTTLSILIPAYEYPEGVARILDSVHRAKCAQLECLVADDSISDGVERVVKQHDLYLQGALVFIKNSPSLGAIRNWNMLMQRASGEYILFLHHDECPIQSDFFGRLLALLECAPDALILDCSIASGLIMRRHFPSLAKGFLLRHMPEYLLRRNFIGAPSVLVVRRDKSLLFDTRLPRLVDVDWYVRLFQQPAFFAAVESSIGVLSTPYSRSITSAFGSRISSMARKESALLITEHPAWWPLKLNIRVTTSDKILAAVETMVWGIFKISYRAISNVLAPKIPRHLR